MRLDILEIIVFHNALVVMQVELNHAMLHKAAIARRAMMLVKMIDVEHVLMDTGMMEEPLMRQSAKAIISFIIL